MNVVELHTWNSQAKAINQPARVIFDLDPGEGVTWAHVQEAALLVRTMLTELGLESWVKTRGGKGLHVVAPLAPKHDYDVVKAFSQMVVQHMAREIPQRARPKPMPRTDRGESSSTGCAIAIPRPPRRPSPPEPVPAWACQCPPRGMTSRS